MDFNNLEERRNNSDMHTDAMAERIKENMSLIVNTPYDDLPENIQLDILGHHSHMWKIKRLPSGVNVGIHELMYTTSICVGVEGNTLYEYRWCFKDHEEAVRQFELVDDLKWIPENPDEVLAAHRYTGRPLWVRRDENRMRIQ